MPYTTHLLSRAHTIFAGVDYIEQLKIAADLFCTFDKALDTFIVAHGYDGASDDTTEKVRFIANKCKSAGVPVPRNLNKWYTEQKGIERNSNTPFQLCFAFGLTIDEADDFLRRICLARGFDCHSVEEAVYFYALKNGLSYQAASDMIDRIRPVEPVRMDGEEIIYTDLLVEEIEEIESPEELVSYLNENVEKFGYNNATAYETIQTLWEEIAKEEGIALREKKILYKSFDKDVEETESGNEDWQKECSNSVCDGDSESTEIKKKKRKERKRIDNSRFEIYLQVLGLAGTYAAKFYQGRSLKEILTDNELLHPLAADCFPDRDGLNKVLNGEHVSYERVRKLLILLVFYRFWASRALKRGDYDATEGEADDCIATMNHHLTSAGYPELYPGNPYDFIILAVTHAPCPLMLFRDYMRELYFEKVDLDEVYGGR